MVTRFCFFGRGKNNKKKILWNIFDNRLTGFKPPLQALIESWIHEPLDSRQHAPSAT